MCEPLAFQEHWACSLRITVCEAVKFETEKRATFVSAFFTFSIPLLTASVLFLETSRKFNDLSKRSKSVVEVKFRNDKMALTGICSPVGSEGNRSVSVIKG